MKLFLPAFCCLILFATASLAQTFQWHKNPVIAHRGAFKKKNLPENSIAALKEAIRLKCYGTEFDVHMTKDSVLVVNHDHDHQGMVIATSTYAALKKLPLKNGESIPTLESYLKEGKKQVRTKLILEIKPDKDPERMREIADAVVAMVRKLKAQQWVEYIGFNYASMLRVLALEPTATVAYLNGDATAEKLKQDGFAGADYHFTAYKTSDWFSKAKELGLTLNAWTVNNAEDMQWLLDNKVEFITTNEPELLFEILKKN
ncbi:glycerophosphodiester phosphodiesterase [Pedobacter immunditicola]|uniref:glycerophosphodiester phosphodiesterase n=1 Tax=Pedobacter immunditicola TaxID=3133440 RepID=UPI0030B6A44D